VRSLAIMCTKRLLLPSPTPYATLLPPYLLSFRYGSSPFSDLILQSCPRPSIQCSCGIETPLRASPTCAMFLVAKQRQIVQPKSPPFGLANGLPEARLFRSYLCPYGSSLSRRIEKLIGTKWSLRAAISSITSIPEFCLVACGG
jgi:hypothetical protein